MSDHRLRVGLRFEANTPRELAPLFGLTLEEFLERFPETVVKAPPLYVTAIDYENKVITLGNKPPKS